MWLLKFSSLLSFLNVVVFSFLSLLCVSLPSTVNTFTNCVKSYKNLTKSKSIFILIIIIIIVFSSVSSDKNIVRKISLLHSFFCTALHLSILSSILFLNFVCILFSLFSSIFQCFMNTISHLNAHANDDKYLDWSSIILFPR